MKVSKNWLKELVDLNRSIGELVSLLPLRTIGVKEVTDDFLELDMKGYNRADLLSMRGVALEVAAITGSKIKFENESQDFIWNNLDLPKTPVKIEDQRLAQAQCVARIEGLRVKASSKEWVKKLGDCGIRSVNNIVDITNLTMLEYGHGQHAFDASSVNDQTIIVRLAKTGEEITTLDGKSRKLTSDDIVLADTKKALDVGGVMGGKLTEVSEKTSTILLSASLFNPEMIRATSQKLGLQSEASKRFYHGLTKTRMLQALDAAIRMYQKIGGKLTAINIVGNFYEEPKMISLSADKVRSLMGIALRDGEIKDYLERLYFELKATKNCWEVMIPYWRLDIELEEDLVEEISRLYGFERIPAKPLEGQIPLQKEDPIFKTISNLKNKLVSLGLTEVQTYSFYSIDVLDALGFDDSNRQFLVKVANPISAETEYLRMNLWPNLVEVVGKNLRHGYRDIGIFEIGKAFNVGQAASAGSFGEPREDYRLAIVLMNGTDNPVAELYKIAQGLPSHIGSGKLVHNQSLAIPNLFHPNRFMAAEKDGKQIGGLAEIHLRMLNRLGIDKRVAILEIELDPMLK